MANFLDTTVDDLIENFEFLGDWEERFAYLIELGKKLPNKSWPMTARRHSPNLGSTGT